jgi:hypothetical protein
MPWCEECSKYWTPSAMNDDGTCPTCGNPVEPPEPRGEGNEKAPWHFKLLVIATVAYLVYRFLDMFGVIS